jgi:hypothetical protein
MKNGTPKMGKEKSEKAGVTGLGGKGHMVGQQKAPDAAAGAMSGASAGKNPFGAKGGNGKMAPATGANPSKPNVVGVNAGGHNSFGVGGGSGKMAGFTGAQASKPL